MFNRPNRFAQILSFSMKAISAVKLRLTSTYIIDRRIRLGFYDQAIQAMKL